MAVVLGVLDPVVAGAPAVATVRAVAPPPITTTTATTTTTSTTTTTTTTDPPPRAHDEMGVASWYAEARPGFCASPYLSFGTVVTVTVLATGDSVRCTVDDRQAENPGRVIDLSYDGFAALASPSRGLVDVRLSW